MPRAAHKDRAPPPIKTSLVHLGQTQPTAFALQCQLFFNSEQWISPLHNDIQALLSTFESEWLQELQKQGTAGGVGGSGGGGIPTSTEGFNSPFQLFRRLWKDKGWSLVHLLGIADGPVRDPWGESVIRGFAEHLVATESPLKQIAALFAIYTFCKSQSDNMNKQYLKIDISTLEHLLSFPSLVAPALDPSKISPLHPSPLSDVSVVLSTLLSPSNPLFILVPPQLYQHPPDLPSVRIKDAREGELDGLAKKLVGIEEEVEMLRDGRDSEVEKLREAQEKAEEEVKVEGSTNGRKQFMEVPIEEGGKQAWISRLSSAASSYVQTKSRSRSLLTRPRSQLQLEVMNEAESATMERVRDIGLEGTVNRGLGGRASVPEKGESEMRMLGLVRGFKRRRTERTGSIVELEKALKQLERSK